MTATHLINRKPSRVLGMKTPCEMMFGKNKFIVPPKVFGCTCFVRDHKPSVGKLDPRAIKCIFVGYSCGQKGYKCWSPFEHRVFVSMDVSFRNPFHSMEKKQICLLSSLILTLPIYMRMVLRRRMKLHGMRIMSNPRGWELLLAQFLALCL